MAGKRTGRPPTLETSPEVGAKIIGLVADGCTQGYAAELCGVDPCLVAEWVSKGRKPNAKECFAKFSQGIKAAKADFIASNLKEIKRHSKQSWQAAAWLLERTSLEFASPETKVRQQLDSIREEFLKLRDEVASKQAARADTADPLEYPPGWNGDSTDTIEDSEGNNGE